MTGLACVYHSLIRQLRFAVRIAFRDFRAGVSILGYGWGERSGRSTGTPVKWVGGPLIYLEGG